MNLRALAIAALFLPLLQTLFAAPIAIPIANPGFEALRGTDSSHFGGDGTLLIGHSSLLPAFPQSATTYATLDPIPQWNVSGIGGTLIPGAGALNPGVTEGKSCSYLDANGALTQGLSTKVEGGNIYRLQVDIGAPAGTSGLQYTFALTAGNEVIARQTGVASIGEMATITLPVLIKADSPLIGASLGVILGNLSSHSGSVLFDNVRLTQESAVGCFQVPSGIVGFWKGDDLLDSVGGTVATFRSDARVGSGFVGAGYVFSGKASAVSLSPSFTLDSEEFSVESWIRRADSTLAGSDPEAGQFFGGSAGGFTVGLTHTGLLYLSHIGVVSFYSTTALRDTGWHHVAVTRTGGALRFYLDGVLRDTVPCTVNFDLSGPYAIGGLGTAYAGISYGFLGSIDELGVYNRAITDAEVLSIYQASVVGRCFPSTRFGADPVPRYVDSTVSTVYRSGITNDGPGVLSNLKLKSGLSVGTTVVGMAATAGTAALEQGVPTATVPLLLPGQSVVLEVTAAVDSSLATFLTNQVSATYQQDGIQFANGPRRSSGRVVAPPALVPPGMVAWWPAESSTADIVGTATGLLSGHAGYAAGLVGNAFSFDGTDSSVQLGSVASLKIQDLTIETWIKRASATSPSQTPGFPGCILGGGVNSYAFAFVPDGHLTFSQVGASRIDSTAVISDTEWHHVGVTRSGSQIRFYLDGVDVGGGAYSPALTFDSPFVIGSLAQVVAGAGTEPFWGLIDELSVYNRALSQGELQSVFRSFSNGKTTGLVDLSGGVITSQPVVFGAFIDYQFRIQNNSASATTGLALTQPLPAGWSVISIASSTGSAAAAGGNISWDPGTLGPGASASLTIRALPGAAGDVGVTATLSGGSGGAKIKSLSMSVVSQPVVIAPPAVRLIAPAVAEIPATGTNRVQIGVSLDRVSPTAVSIDYGVYPAFKAGVHVVEAIYGTAVVPPGALQSAIPLPLIAGTTADMGSLFVQVIAVRGGATPPQESLIIPVKAPYAADLAVSASAIQAAIRPGGLVSGTVLVNNRGTGAASQVRLTNSLPAGWVIAGLNASTGTTTLIGDSLVWDLGDLDPGATASLTVSARPTTLGSGVLTASVGTPSTDVDASNNRVEYAFALTLLPEVNLGADVAVTAPTSGVLTVPVPVRLSDPAAGPVVVSYATVDGTAIAGRDFKALQGTLTIPAGEVQGSLPLEILGGRVVVDDLAFQVRLTDVTGAAFGRTNVAVVVSHVVVADLAATVDATSSQGYVNEGLPLRFTLGNLGPAVATAPRGTLVIPAGWTIRKTTASDGSVQTTDGQLVWSPGALAVGAQSTLELEVAAASPGSGRFALTVSGPEPDLQSDNNAAFVDLRADAMPEVRIGSDLSVPVPLSVARVASVQVSLSAASFRPVSIEFTTADGTAASGRDYQVSAGTLNFPAGTTVQTVPISVLPNPNAGTNTTFSVRLSNPVGAQLGRDSLVITLLGEPAQVSVQRFDPKAGEFAVRIHALPGRVYELQKATSLDANEWNFVSDASVATGEADVELSDPFAGEAPFAFYRVVVTSR